MIFGKVNTFREARVSVNLVLPSGKTRTITCMIDTGFNGFLTLPPKLISTLGLDWIHVDDAWLANASKVHTRVFVVDVEWGGAIQTVQVHETENVPLLGTFMLVGCHLAIDMIEGGDVTIRPVSKP